MLLGQGLRFGKGQRRAGPTEQPQLPAMTVPAKLGGFEETTARFLSANAPYILLSSSPRLQLNHSKKKKKS